MHNPRTERFFEPVMINGMMASQDGPIKTFPLCGIKDSPPYLHDGRRHHSSGRLPIPHADLPPGQPAWMGEQDG